MLVCLELWQTSVLSDKNVPLTIKVQEISVDMEFYFPPKEKSVALLQAEKKLAAKGYAFSKEKRMCRYDQDNQRLDENKGFVFEVRKGDKAYNQKNYEEIGEILTDFVYGLLESDPMNLVRKEVQKDEDSEGIYNSSSVY